MWISLFLIAGMDYYRRTLFEYFLPVLCLIIVVYGIKFYLVIYTNIYYSISFGHVRRGSLTTPYNISTNHIMIYIEFTLLVTPPHLKFLFVPVFGMKIRLKKKPLLMHKNKWRYP